MAEQTDISWAEGTFNPWEGCQETGSTACLHCYAKARNARFNGGVAVNWGPRAPRRRTAPGNWKKIAAWNRKAELLGAPAGTKPFIFGGSLCDVFDNAVPAEWRREYFDEIRAAPNLVFLLLTKRPQNIREMAEAAGGLPPNAAIGCTVVNQAEAERDIPHLLMAAEALKPLFVFLSMEPLAGDVNLRRLTTLRFRGAELLDALTGVLSGIFGDYVERRLPKVDWVITGGESGPHAEPANFGWFYHLERQCADAGTPFHHKQNGEWTRADPPNIRATTNSRRFRLVDGVWMARVGRKKAGHDLRGKVVQQRPFIPVEKAA